ncbi:hypothetical protein SDC9_160828 [bioreactor metagenome]|uniref:Uncharacterized protein n=1 Tax=bioreactor metagenome TaxID=1076179 RepID=A0A645FGP6_9ZZZZ
MAQRVIIHGHIHRAKTVFLIRDSPSERGFNVRFTQRLKGKQTAAADNGRRHGDHGIFCGGADKADQPFLDRGQDAVRLRLAPAVALVEQQVGSLAVHFPPVISLLEHLANLCYA